MLKIALTGNIASGKTEVEKYLANKGFKVLCLDEATKKIYEYDEEFKNILNNYFGTSNKSEISAFIFKDKEKLRTLEKIIHPRIKDKMFNFFDKNNSEKLVIVSAAMLFESGFDNYFDKIIFVSSNNDMRLKRLMQRNNFTEDEAKLRLEAQNPEEEKISKSNYIIKNNSSLADLYKACDELIKELNTL